MRIPDWIEPFVKSSYQLFIHHDPAAHLPFDAWGLHPYYNDLWLKKLHKLVSDFQSRGYKVCDYLGRFPNLSSSRFLVLMTIIHYQTSKMDNPKLITDILDFFVESIKLRAKSDLFASDKNIEFSRKELAELIQKRPLKKPTPEEAKEIGKILVALASLTHGLYNDWCTDYNYEISGPYRLGGQIVLLRTFPDTKPEELWPDINWRFRDFSLITTYRDLEAKIAFVGCHIIYSGNTVEKLSGYNFMVNGEEISGKDRLTRLRAELMPIAVNQFEKFMAMAFEDQKVKYLYQEGYQLKRLFDLLGIDWRPSAEMIDRIKDKNLILGVFPSYEMTEEKYKEIFGVNKVVNAYGEI